MTDNQPPKYELLISASALEQQLGSLQLGSADALFSMVAAVNVSGMSLLIEAWACSVSLGQPLVYRLILRVAQPQSLLQQS